MNATPLMDSSFDATLNSANKPVLVDFYADWCGPCRMLSPIIDQIADEQRDRTIVTKVNIDEAPEIAAKYGITSIPTLIVFEDGQPVASTRGVQSKAVIEKLIAQAA